MKYATIILYNLKSWQHWFIKTGLKAKANRPMKQPNPEGCGPGRPATG